jgi:hypothetical protein
MEKIVGSGLPKSWKSELESKSESENLPFKCTFGISTITTIARRRRRRRRKRRTGCSKSNGKVEGLFSNLVSKAHWEDRIGVSLSGL